MMMDYITLAGLLLAVFVTGVAVGRTMSSGHRICADRSGSGDLLVEKIERFISKKEDEEHGNTQKNNRR